ncbi:MAG: FtsW/RodA/SpoVE family cell cycle protein [Motilibacteraceae bacterium]
MLTVERGWGGGGRPQRRRPRPPRRHLDVRGYVFDLLAVAAAATLGWLSYRNLMAMGARTAAEHQILAVALGLVLLLVLRQVRSERALKLVAWTVYGLALVTLVAVRFVGLDAYGARRWLSVGGFTFQPSELAKVGVLMVLAVVLTSHRSPWRRVALALALALVPVVIVAVQPDLSTAVLLTLLAAALLVLSRVPVRLLGPLAVSVALLAPLAVGLLQPYQLARLHAFSAGPGSEGPGWAVQQAHIAVASGGLFGLDRGPLGQLAAQYLPGRETDFALASLVQHEGLVAAGLALLAIAVLVWRCALASRAPGSRAGGLVAAGLAVLLCVEALVSVGGNLGALPVAGVPFPLLSYGGTAAAAHLAALGVVLGLRREYAGRRLWAPPRWSTTRPRLVRFAALGASALLVGLAVRGYGIAAEGAGLRAAATAQMTRCVPIPAPRGQITDRHGAVLARDGSQSTVYAVPGLLERPAGAVERLARLLGQTPAQLRAALDRPTDTVAVTVAAGVPAAVSRRVSAAQLTGVFVVRSPQRVYPTGALLGPVLGFVGVATPDDVARLGPLAPGTEVGRTGLEQRYDGVLRGVDGAQCVYVDPRGRAVAPGPRREPVPGATLRTTLDLPLQRVLTRSLAAALAAGHGRDLGGSVVMDPRTGQVLAMASLPSYDNSIYGPPVNGTALARLATAPGNPMLEHVTQVAAPPGSTFKLVVAATDMVHKALPPSKVIPTGGSFTYGNHVFGNWSTFGPQNMTEAIAWSNDVYFYKLALALGPRAIHEVGTALGVGRPTGIDLPGEEAGFFGSPDNIHQIGATWYAGSTVILGIGQGYLTVTPLQDALWTAGVATGTRVTPHLGLAVVSGKSVTALPQPAPVRLPFAKALGPVRAGMRAAVTQGTASILRDLPVAAGGKTGSAEDARASNGKPSSWFTAVAPLARPAVTATSYVRGGEHGATTSGPVVHEAMAYFLAHQKQIMATGPGR